MWARLASTNVGRLGITVRALPIVVPVNYLPGDDESLVFAVEPRTVMSGAIDGSVFAFEAGGFDAESEGWWSVIARGRVTLTASSHPAVRVLDQLGLRGEVTPAIGLPKLMRGGEVVSSAQIAALSAYLSTAC